jgi:hypothetical protein
VLLLVSRPEQFNEVIVGDVEEEIDYLSTALADNRVGRCLGERNAGIAGVVGELLDHRSDASTRDAV